MPKVFISTTSFSQFSKKPLELMESEGLTINLNDKGRKLSENEIITALNGYDSVIAGTETYNENVLKRLPNLKVISRLGVGIDNIDLEFVKRKNIKVYKTQTTPAPAVAELTLGMILDLLRKISFQNNQLKNGTWKKNMGSLLSGKTLGIVGLGTIGKNLVEITQGFGLKYLAHDIQQDEGFVEKYKIKYCKLNELLASSDVVSIHLNLSEETNNLIDSDALNYMKRNAVLINTSRGEVIDEVALVKALDENNIAGVGLDVYRKEPYNGPLTNYNNVVTTPHIGAYAKEIRMIMELEAAQNLIEGLKIKQENE